MYLKCIGFTFFYHKPNIFHIFNPTPPNHTVLQQNLTTTHKKEQQDHPVTLDQFINASKHLAI